MTINVHWEKEQMKGSNNPEFVFRVLKEALGLNREGIRLGVRAMHY